MAKTARSSTKKAARPEAELPREEAVLTILDLKSEGEPVKKRLPFQAALAEAMRQVSGGTGVWSCQVDLGKIHIVVGYWG